MSKHSSPLPRGVRRLFRLPVSPERMVRELDDEARAHIEMRVDELHSLGMSDADARAEALRRFGDPNEFHHYVQRRATSRARRHGAVEWVREWMQDVRFGLRQSRRNAGLTALIVLTLALGIGANTAIFTIVHRLMLAPLPYPNGDRLVMLAMENDKHGMSQPRGAAVHAWRTRARSIESIAAMNIDFIMVQDATEQDTIHAAVTTNFLQLLGIQPALGRGFTPDEARPGSGVAMISYGLWQRKYGGRADVLGARVLVDGGPHTIVGVAPPEMGIPISYWPAGSKFREATPSIWLPSSLDSLEGTDTFARLRPGVSAARASKELQTILDSVPLPP
ncbi:MAG TPA: ABC transporter permease, partial [Gemmatimonadaceae bacterium]|nr:ABC transporter permease [Gemmatimonadaceae bacterium]